MTDRATGPQDPAGEPPAALVSVVENHPHHAVLLWGARLRCVALSRPLRHYFGVRGRDPAQAAALLEVALHDPARRVLHAGTGETGAVRLLGEVSSGVHFCPAGLGGVLVLLPALPRTPDGHGHGQGPAREKATLRDILDALPLPLLVVFGARGEERLFNAAARALLGPRERDEAPGEPYFTVSSRWGERRGDGSVLPEEARPLWRALRQRETVRGVEVSFSLYSGDTPAIIDGEDAGQGDERRVYLESAAPILGSAGASGPGDELLGAVAVFQEITEQKRADRQKDRFLEVAGQELRTPLTVLRTQTQLISRWLDELPAEQIRQVAEGIDQQAERLAQLVDDLLDVGRLSTGKAEIRDQELDLVQLTRDVVARRPGAGDDAGRHRVRVEAAQPALWVRGDALRVEQVLGTLLANARHFAPPHTEIVVTVSRGEDHGEVSVRDQGPAVPPAERERIFERFHKGERAVRGDLSGLGIGLWISRKLVELMGGRIWVEGEGTRPAATGATFAFQLPLST